MKTDFNNNVGVCIQVVVCLCVAALVAATDSVVSLGQKQSKEDDILILLKSDGLIPISNNISKGKKDTVLRYSEYFKVTTPAPRTEIHANSEEDLLLEIETDFLMPAESLLQRRKRQVIPSDLVVGSGNVAATIQAIVGLSYQFSADLNNPSSTLYIAMKAKAEAVLTELYRKYLPNFNSVEITGFSDGGTGVTNIQQTITLDVNTAGDRLNVAHALQRMLNTRVFGINSQVLGNMAMVNPTVEDGSNNPVAAMCYLCPTTAVCDTSGTLANCGTLVSTPSSNLFPWGFSQLDDTVAQADDATSQAINIDVGFPFDELVHNQAYVGTNGILSLGSSYNPPNLAGLGLNNQFIICPYCVDIDMRNADSSGNVFFHVYSSGDSADTAVTDRATNEVQLHTSDATFQATTVLVATWDRVPPYTDESGNLSPKRATFQTVLITDGQKGYLMIFYDQGAMGWDAQQYKNAVIGYSSMTNFVYTSLYSQSGTRGTMDTIIGNTGLNGVWMFKIGEKIVGTNYAQKCYSWYLSNLRNKNDLLTKAAELPKCPCTAKYFYFDRTFLRRKVGNIDCYDTAPFFGLVGKNCCYNNQRGLISTMPDSGNFHRYSIFVSKLKNRNEDTYPKTYCCERSSLCALYYELRPTDTPGTCVRESYMNWALMYGDPHITTLDGLGYTFNGLGEYLMMDLTTSTFTFVLHGRTGKMQVQSGALVNATVFTAFGAKNSDGGTLQVEMSDSKTHLAIYGNGRDYSVDFETDKNFPVVTPTLTLEKVGPTSLLSTFSNKISLNITLSLNVLTISVAVPQQFKNLPTGLLGNFNGDPTDDVKYRDGTQLLSTVGEQALYKMGQTWQIELNASASMMFYHPGYSPKDFVDPTFVPIFLDQVDAATKDAAVLKCGSSTATSCIYDFVATGSEAIAIQTREVVIDSSAKVIVNQNAPPVISGTTVLNALIGQNVTLLYEKSDSQNDSTSFVIFEQPESGFTFDNISGKAVWLPVNASRVAISLTAVDDKGLQAAPLEVTIMLCTGCNSNGECDYTKPQTVATSAFDQRFQIAMCNCFTGWTGLNCSQDFDACSESPCATGQNCTDLTPVEQAVRGIGYNCSACSTGYEANNRKCQDVNECTTSNICPSNSTCENSIGSYRCVCYSGFRLSMSGECVDIDECTEHSYNCMQLCINNVGGYSCDCFDGYNLWTDGAFCNQTTVSDLCAPLNCSHGCRNISGKGECFCRTGYSLQTDKKTCININECDLNLCSQSCVDSEGSYQCSCYAGYKLALDKLACERCPFPSYGPDCSLQCNCYGHASSCDPVHGCVCITGWSGINCTDDINECVDTPAICGDRFICTNTIGSYQCTCPSGFLNNGTSCLDIDECGTGLDNCSQNCDNNLGSFVCSCLEGYNKQGYSGCVDINECAAGLATCEQICDNLEGSYNCLCEFGYVLNNDRKTCKLVEDPCKFYQHLSCDHYCSMVNQQPQCQCNYGYKLATDKQSCIDVDECTSTDPSIVKCSDTCTNTIGSFTCSCPVGKMLDNDLKTCLGCDPFHWGENCTNECLCDAIGSSGCDATTGCQCKSGWVGTRCENDRNECNSIDTVCPANSVCNNLPGSYQCVCKTGYVNSSNTCINVNECLVDKTNVCDHQCADNIGSYTCSCNTGFKLIGKGTCQDIDECTLKQDNCDQICRNTLGGFTCECFSGYSLNTQTRNTCTVVTECTTAKKTTCDHGCRIVNQVEECFCNSGFTLAANGTTCIDINECDLNICTENCTNSNGGYACACMSGKKLEADKVTCRECDAGFYGMDCGETCACNISNTASCDRVTGSCTCNSGWNGTICDTNINECSLTGVNCESNAVCRDTPGSYVCDCDIGFVRTGIQCTACDRRTNYGQDCSQSCSCVITNTVTCDTKNGSCDCKQGWEGVTCNTNINECNVNQNICTDVHESCVDNPGSYSCVCDTGFSRDANGKCVDINECLDSTLNTCQFACNNTEGSFFCYCPAGYTGTLNQCTDIDECTLKTDGCQQGCTNNPGSFVCTCNTGYIVNVTQPKVCDDVNECLDTALNNCTSPSQTCLNSVGSFSCECSPGFAIVNGICKSVKTSYLVSLKLDLTDKDVIINTGSSSQGYIALSDIIAEGVYSTLKPIVGESLLSVTAGNLITGSVGVGITLEIDNTKTNRPASKIAKAINYLLDVGKLTINGSEVALLEVKYGAVPVTEPLSMCQVLNIIESCGTGEVCLVAEGEPQCQVMADTTNNLPLILGLGVGIPAFLLLLVIIIFLCYLWRNRKKKEESHHSSSEDRYNAFRSVFAGTLPTKGSWGASRFQMYSPDTLSDAASTRSGGSGGHLLHGKGQGKGRTDFQDTPWFNHSRVSERSTNRGQQRTPRGAEEAPTSNFSWEYMFRVLEPLKNFEIQRPAVSPAPNRVYKHGKKRPDSLA